MSSPHPFAVDDRVRMNPLSLSVMRMLWAHRLGTVTRVGPWRVYVRWDGCKSSKIMAATELVAAALEFGVEPATTG